MELSELFILAGIVKFSSPKRELCEGGKSHFFCELDRSFISSRYKESIGCYTDKNPQERKMIGSFVFNFSSDASQIFSSDASQFFICEHKS